jgi:hypothetical protein
MDNKAEDELIKRWKAEDRKKQQENGQDKEESRSRKCPRKAIEQDSTSATVISDDDDQYRLYSYFVEGVQSAIPGTRRKVKD